MRDRNGDAALRRRDVSAAKCYVGKAARFVGQQAVQLHGGMGMADELAVSHYFKRLTMIDMTFGDSTHHLAAVSDAILLEMPGGRMSVRDAFNLEGRTALVTGGSRGLGLAMAGALGEMGAKVVISARKSDELDAAVASLKLRGVTAVRVVGDLSRAENVNPFVDAVAAAAGAPIDILVNNAGATWGAPAEEHPLEGWNKVIGLNLTGVFLLTQQIGARWMIPRRQGRIVNIASVAGLKGARRSICAPSPITPARAVS